MTRRPSILFVIGSLREGGAEGQVLHLMRGLRARGWRVAVMLLRYEGVRLEEVLAEGFEVIDGAVPVFRPRWSPLPWLRLPWALWRARRFLRHWKPDIVHAWLFWAHLWAALMLVGNRRFPFITSRRQTWSDTKNSGTLKFLERAILNITDLVISNSRVVAQSSLRNEGRGYWHKPRRIVIYNGLDFVHFQTTKPAELREEFPALADATHIAITVANLLPHKGYDTLIAAWKQVHEKYPGAKILCVGSDGGIQAKLEPELQRTGLARHVIFPGLRRDVAALLKGAHFAVHASHDEGFSNAVLEYMAAGLATVAADAGGNCEALGHGEGGLIVPVADAGALAGAILRVIENDALRRRLAATAQAIVKREFTIEQMVRKHEKRYQWLLKGRKNP